MTRADGGHRAGDVAGHRGRAPGRSGQRHLPRRRDPRPCRRPYGILEDYTGHGIGSQMHQPPNVPNYGRAGRGPKLVRGLALAVEPMVTLGTPRDRRARRRLDGGDHRRQRGGALRAHLHPHPERRLGAHRARRRGADARRARACRSAAPEEGARAPVSKSGVAAFGGSRRSCHTVQRRRGVFPEAVASSVRPGPGPARCHRLGQPSGRDLRSASPTRCTSVSLTLRRNTLA